MQLGVRSASCPGPTSPASVSPTDRANRELAAVPAVTSRQRERATWGGFHFCLQNNRAVRIYLGAGAESGRGCVGGTDTPPRGILRMLRAAAWSGDRWVWQPMSSFPPPPSSSSFRVAPSCDEAANQTSDEERPRANSLSGRTQARRDFLGGPLTQETKLNLRRARSCRYQSTGVNGCN